MLSDTGKCHDFTGKLVRKSDSGKAYLIDFGVDSSFAM